MMSSLSLPPMLNQPKLSRGDAHGGVLRWTMVPQLRMSVTHHLTPLPRLRRNVLRKIARRGRIIGNRKGRRRAQRRTQMMTVVLAAAAAAVVDHRLVARVDLTTTAAVEVATTAVEVATTAVEVATTAVEVATTALEVATAITMVAVVAIVSEADVGVGVAVAVIHATGAIAARETIVIVIVFAR